MAIDDRIPFCEFFIVPYFLWFAYIAWIVLYLFFKNKNDYYKSCTFSIAQEKLSRESYKKLEQYIRSIGGYYSRFKHGFLFRSYPTELAKEA